LAEKAARKVGYTNPLTQTITNTEYVKSHVELLAEEASPYSATEAAGAPNPAERPPWETLDLAMAYTGDETKDGGMTPGPFEEMRRRMAGLGGDTLINTATTIDTATSERERDTGSESESGTDRPGKRRRRGEKRRRWVWTIGVGENGTPTEETPVTAKRIESASRPNSRPGSVEPPLTAIRTKREGTMERIVEEESPEKTEMEENTALAVLTEQEESREEQNAQAVEDVCMT
jgi:hypothetical protein